MRVNPGTGALGYAKLSLQQATSFLDFAEVFKTLFKISIPGQDPPKDPNDYKNENSDYGLLVRGKKAREKLNKAAKEILSRVTNPADLNEEERAILKQYSGKGGLSDNSQYEYYTPQHVAEGVWSGLVANGMSNGNILDPSCFVPTTLVKTREGRKPISEILNGDQVFCHDGGYHEVVNLVSHDVEASLVAIEVSAFPSPLESTSDHELYAVQTKKCTARKDRPCHVQQGETCQYLQRYGSKTRKHRCGEPWKSYVPSWVPAEKLQIGDCLVEVFDRTVEDVSTLVLSEERTANLRGPLSIDCDIALLKAIGIYLAEGFVDENSVIFAFREDETDMHEALISAFEPHGWKVNVVERENNESSRFMVHSRSLVGLMKQFGRGAENKAIPAWCMTLPLEKQAALLWGIWRGDGSTSKDGITAVASVSKELAFGIRDILYRFGIVPSVGIRTALKPETKLILGQTITRQLPMYSVDIYGEHLENAAKVFGIQHPQIEARSHTRNLSGVVKDGMVFHKVKQTSRFDYAGKVHDLTVEGAHSYTAGPCTVHNCGHGMFSATKPAGMVITGCDLDPVASKVAQLLNAGDSITNKSFEKFCSDTPDNSFDGCCTNVPFGDARGAYKFDDPPYKNEGKIQRYFISRILDKIKPGGLAVLIVPTDIVGAKGSTDWAKWRNSVSRKAEFLGAHKLPSKTFAAQGTDTVVDVVVFRKHPQSLLDIVNDLSFETLMSTNVIFDEFIAGRYWLGEGRPFIMGKWVPKIAGDRFSREAVDGDVDDAGLKAKLASRFVSRIDWAALAVAEPVPRNYVEGDRKVINGIECEMQQGAWTRVASVDDKEALDPQKYGAASIEELKARLDSPKGCLSFTAYQLFAIYKTYPDLLSALASASVEFAMSQPKEELAEQLFRGSIIGGMIARYQDRFNNGSADDSERLALQDLISNEIDRFGHPKNNRGIMLTGESSKMFGLFSNALDEKGNFSDLLNGTLEDSGRHLQYDSTNVQSLVEHLFIREGIQTIELDDVQKLYTGGLPVASLGDLAAFDNVAISPDGIIYPMSRYCSGDIYPKLQALYAAMADETDERIKAKYMQMIGIINGKRKKTKPEDVAFDFNHKWYSKSYVLDFLKENGYPQVTYGSEQEVQKEDPYSGKMRTVKEWVQDPENPFGSFRILGGKKPAGFDLQFENYMNGKPIRGGKDDDDGDLKKQYYDNIKNFRETFNMWMQQQPNIDELAEQYNMKFNAFLPPEYEMTDLGLQGVSKKIVLHGYQNAAIRRFSEEGRGILADDVGLGKTLQTLALVKYNLQMGRSKKTCIVVPKAVFSNWYHEARNYYEGMDDALFVGMRFDRAKDGVILQEPVLDEAGNQKINKYTNEAMWQDKIASGEFDATEVYDDMWQIPQSNVKLVVMTYEKFKSIPLRPDTKQGFIDKWSQRGLLSKQAIKANSEGKDDEVGDEKSLNYNEVKQVERAEGKFADTGAKKGELPYFEDMGFTDVITDEFHSYKNSFEAGEEASRLAYVSTAPASQRGLDMQMKMGHIRATNNDRGSYGLTATPVTNSPVEIFNMLAYVMPLEEFERFGVFTPDDFIRVFGQKDIVDKMTIANETKATEGLVGFQNLDGLRNIFHKYCLLRTAKDVDLDLPPSEEFHEEAILTDEQQGIYDELKEEAKAATKDDSSKFSGDPRPVFSIIRDMEQVSMDPDIFHRRMTFHFAKGDQEKVKQLLKIIPQEVSVRVTPRVGDPEYDLERAEMGEPQKAVSRIYRLLDSLETDLKGDVFIVRLADAFEPFLMDAKKLRDVKLDVGTVGHPLTPKYALLVDRVQKIHELGGKQIIFSDEKAQHQKVARILTHYLPMLRSKIGIINADEAKGSELQRISDRYNSGEYSMVICNQKAEVGVNLQKGTRAIHHLTFPWTPSSIQQRNGRGVRQGNEADNIKIYYYQGKGSFDAYRLHLISKKAGWIGDIFRSDSSTAANANAASADEIRFMFEDNPEEAKRKYMEVEAKKAEKAKAQAKARLVNQLQVLASNASVLPRLDAAKEEDRVKYTADIDKLKNQIANLRDRGMRLEEGSDDRKEISKTIQNKQDTLDRTQWKLDNLDSSYDRQKAEVQSRINKITLELRVKAQKGELSFDEKLIDNPGNCVVTPKGIVLTVGDMYEFEYGYGGKTVIKVIEVNSASRGFKADALLGQLNWNSIPKQSDNDWYDVQDFIADRSPVKVSYSEKEMALQKLLSQEWRYADLLRGDLDKETFTEHYDKIRFYSYDGFVLRGAQGILFGKPQTGLTVSYPDEKNEAWKKEVCEAYLALKRANRAYEANSVMKLIFGYAYDAVASEYGRKATEAEVLTACSTAWQTYLKESGYATQPVIPGVAVVRAAGDIKVAAQALGDNTSEINTIAERYMNSLKEDLRAKEAQAREEAERLALEAIKNDPNFKEVPEQVKAAFLALGITVKTNNTNVVIPGYKGRPGKSHAPFTSWFFQDRNGFNGVLRRVSPMMKTRWSAQFFSETGGDFNGAWWYVPISTDLAEVYKLMA